MLKKPTRKKKESVSEVFVVYDFTTQTGTDATHNIITVSLKGTDYDKMISDARTWSDKFVDTSKKMEEGKKREGSTMVT